MKKASGMKSDEKVEARLFGSFLERLMHALYILITGKVNSLSFLHLDEDIEDN
jgi:hypothetical protein